MFKVFPLQLTSNVSSSLHRAAFLAALAATETSFESS